MEFKGIARELPAFMRALKANNSREWFEPRKQEFQAVCVEPMLALVAALEPAAAGLVPPHKAEARLNGSLRRIHRDTRFSKDKTPYHDHLHLIFWTGSHPNRSPGVHLVFGADGFGIGAGYWAFDTGQLDRFRQSVSGGRAWEELAGILAALEADGQVVDEPPLKRVPAGFEAASALQEKLLRSKGLVVRTQGHEPLAEALFGEGAVDWLVRRMRLSSRINGWLEAHVGGF